MHYSNIKKFSKILFLNAIIFLIISFPLYAPIILISSGINQSLKYIQSHKDLKKVPDFFILERLAILAARLNYHNVPYRNIITTDKDCFSQSVDLIYKPNPFSKCIQSNLEFKNEINFGKYGNRTDEFFKSDKKINLIVIGDSHAMGWGVGDNEVFSALLNKSDINTLNLSVPSYGTYRQLEYLKNWSLKYPNDFKEIKNIVIQYCANDLKENIYAIDENNIIPNIQIEQYKVALELDDNPYHLPYGESYLSILKDFKLLRRSMITFFKVSFDKFFNSDYLLKVSKNIFAKKENKDFDDKDLIHLTTLKSLLKKYQNLLSEKNLYIFVANPYGYEVERISKVFKKLEKDRELFLNISIIPPSKTSLNDIKSYYLLDDHINPLGHYNLYNSIKSVIN